MSLKYCMLGLLVMSCIVSCKSDKEEQKPAVENQGKTKTSDVKVVLDAIVPVDDDFQLYYNEDQTLNFDNDHSVVVNVKGQDKSQLITFYLSNDALPTALRLDPGYVKTQQKITLNSFTVEYYDKKITAKGADIFKYFQPNDNIVVTGNTLTPKIVAGNYDPMLYPGSDLLNDLRTLLVK